MLRTILVASIRTRGILRTLLPSNILLDFIRTRAGLKWGMPAMLISVVHFAIAYGCTVAIDNGRPGWLHLVFLVCVWSAFKFLIMGPVSLVLLANARGVERVQRQRAAQATTEIADGDESNPAATSPQKDPAAS